MRAADATSTGSVAGTVASTSTRNALQGATVSIPSLNRTELTDSSGTFLLTNVPAGPLEIVVSYSGFADTRQTVVVASGQTAKMDLQMRPSQDVFLMEAFTVASEREGAALSITEQRNASNIKNVVALDEWGNLPTLSVADVAMRLPGITWTNDEDDVVNNVSIRGQPNDFTRLNVDGMSSTGVGGNGRNATLHSFSAAMYEQIEVIMGQTPDRRADGLGGQLNLKTRSPLSMSEKRRFNYNVSTRWAPPGSNRTAARADHPIHPVFNLSYLERFDAFGGHRNLGVSVNVSYTEGVSQIAQDNLFYGSPGGVLAFNDYTTTTGLNHRFVYGIGTRVDYKPNPRSRYTLNFIYNSGKEPYYDRTRIDPIGNSTTSIVPGFTDKRTELRPVAGASGTRMDVETWRYSFVSKNPTGTFTAEHDLGRLKLDYAGRWSNTHWHSGSGQNQNGGALLMRLENIGFILDQSNLDGQVFTQTTGHSVYDANNYRSNLVFTQRDTVMDTNEVSGTFNAQYTLPVAIPASVKAGLDTVNRRVNNRQVYPRRWTRATNPAVVPLSGFPLMPLTRFEERNSPAGQRIPAFDPAAVYPTLTDTSLWTEDITAPVSGQRTNRRLFEEAVDAVYFQAQGKFFGRLLVLGGVRVEDVKVDTFTYMRRVTDASRAELDPVRRVMLEWHELSREGEYRKTFPSVHVGYDITPNLKLRASWSGSYGRPHIGQLFVNTSVTEADEDTIGSISTGNPEVLPQVSTNTDIKLEYYSKKRGVFSVSFFDKHIKDYILTRDIGTIPAGNDNGFDGQFAGYTLRAPTNAGDATVRGYEADFRQPLTFLPGPLKGLGIGGNFTWLKATGRFTNTNPIDPNDVPGFIPRTGNARLTYTYRKFGASAVLNFTSKHLHALSPLSPALNRLYRKDLTRVNVGVSYKIRPEATIYLDVNNVFEEAEDTYRYLPAYTRRTLWAGRTINVGVSGQF